MGRAGQSWRRPLAGLVASLGQRSRPDRDPLCRFCAGRICLGVRSCVRQFRDCSVSHRPWPNISAIAAIAWPGLVLLLRVRPGIYRLPIRLPSPRLRLAAGHGRTVGCPRCLHGLPPVPGERAKLPGALRQRFWLAAATPGVGGRVPASGAIPHGLLAIPHGLLVIRRLGALASARIPGSAILSVLPVPDFSSSGDWTNFPVGHTVKGGADGRARARRWGAPGSAPGCCPCSVIRPRHLVRAGQAIPAAVASCFRHRGGRSRSAGVACVRQKMLRAWRGAAGAANGQDCLA
jgi:hypothetical protein